jgi:DNA-directed RNA polymerase sigma subunit (sigma70/sigma32)
MAQEQSENSILDRVMSSQQDSLAKDLNPYEIVVKLGRGLSPREREVVSLRFGLGKY